MNDFFMEKVAPTIVFVLVLLTLGVLVVGFIDMCTKHETIALRVDEWECSDTKQYTTTILVGKVMVPQVHNMCIRYTRK